MTLPRSCARWYDPFISVGVALALLVWLLPGDMLDLWLACLAINAVMVPMLFFEWLRARGNYMHPPNPLTAAVRARAFNAWVGIMASAGVLYFFWWLFPLYRESYFSPLRDIALFAVPVIAVLAMVYVVLIERYSHPEEDIYQQLGYLVRGKWRMIDWDIARKGSLMLLIRIAFLPLNFCAVVSIINDLRMYDLMALGELPWAELNFFIMRAILLVMMVVIVPGYLFNLRLFNTHIQKVEQSWFGWSVTLACYPPLVMGVFSLLLQYKGGEYTERFMKPWVELTAPYPMLAFVLGGLIILISLIHLWGEATIGIRASNLAHRGVVNNGPYRYCRHPVYASKCINWCLISLPFLMGDTWVECLRLTVLWCGVCFLYAMRSWVEERLLASDPDYEAYALWVDKHGVFSWFGSRLPWLTFEWRLARWKRNGFA